MDFLSGLQNFPIISYVLVAILGLIIGSFLNVIIYRYPIMLKNEWRQECQEFLTSCSQTVNPAEPKPKIKFNLVTPRSHCPHCHKPIAIKYNIPILSYFLLKGKCASCAEKISLKYPLVELLTAILSIFVVAHFGLTAQSCAALIWTWGLILLTMIDINEQLLPDLFTLSLLWFGLIVSIFYLFVGSQQAIIGAVTGYVLLWIVAKAFHIIRKKDGMGHGDFKMLAMMGAWVGINNLLNVLLFSVIIALLVSLILLLQKKIKSDHAIPFGPFLALGGWTTLMFGPFMINWIYQFI